MNRDYLDYNNEERPYIPKQDPRSINVVKNIEEDAQKKSGMLETTPKVISISHLQHQLSLVESELAQLKNATLVDTLLSAFQFGGYITIPDSVDFDTAVQITEDVTVDLNGKSLTIKEDTVGDGVFHVTQGTLTITGNGCINGVGWNDYNMAIWADGGNVIIDSGKFTNVGAIATEDPTHMDLIYAKNGATVEINGGFFHCVTPKWTLNKHDGTESSIIVRGGTFVNYDPSNVTTEINETSFVAEGYKVVSETQSNGDIWYTVVAE